MRSCEVVRADWHHVIIIAIGFKDHHKVTSCSMYQVVVMLLYGKVLDSLQADGKGSTETSRNAVGPIILPRSIYNEKYTLAPVFTLTRPCMQHDSVRAPKRRTHSNLANYPKINRSKCEFTQKDVLTSYLRHQLPQSKYLESVMPTVRRIHHPTGGNTNEFEITSKNIPMSHDRVKRRWLDACISEPLQHILVA